MKGWSGVSFFFLAVQITQSDVRHFWSQIRKFGIHSEEATQDLVCQGENKKKQSAPEKAEGLLCGVKGKEHCFPISALSRPDVFSSPLQQFCSFLQRQMPKNKTKQNKTKKKSGKKSSYPHNVTLKCTQKEQTHRLGPIPL